MEVSINNSNYITIIVVFFFVSSSLPKTPPFIKNFCGSYNEFNYELNELDFSKIFGESIQHLIFSLMNQTSKIN